MNQQCKVCGEPAAGFHFGAFTCEGCKSFFGRSYNNLGSISECKNNGECVINKKNRTSCKACRLRKCLMVGMSKSGSRYGRRSNWFKIHCLLQEQKQKEGTEQKLQMQIASLNRSKEELLLLGLDEYKRSSSPSPGVPSPDSISDSSDSPYRNSMKELSGGLGYQYPYLFPHPAYLPPLYPTSLGSNGGGYYLTASRGAICYDDNFNHRLLPPRSPSPDSPIDLSIKGSTTAAEDSTASSVLSEEDDEDMEEEDVDITVDDDLPPEDISSIIRRTTPLDLTTRVN